MPTLPFAAMLARTAHTAPDAPADTKPYCPSTSTYQTALTIIEKTPLTR